MTGVGFRLDLGSGMDAQCSARTGYRNGRSILSRIWVRERRISGQIWVYSRTKETHAGVRGFPAGSLAKICWISDPTGVLDLDHRAARTPSSPGISPLLRPSICPKLIASRPWKLRPGKLPPRFSVDVESSVSNFFS